MNIKQMVVATLAFAIPGIGSAGISNTVPEPETIALIGIGAVALIIGRWRKRK
jgi:hypothetical protein